MSELEHADAIDDDDALFGGSRASDSEASANEGGERHTSSRRDDADTAANDDDDLFGDNDDPQVDETRAADGGDGDGDGDGSNSGSAYDDEFSSGGGRAPVRLIPYGVDAHVSAEVEPAAAPADSKLALTKFPSVLAIEHAPFDAASFVNDTQQHARSHSTATENILRWRRSPDDGALPESNARLVRWPDGSMQLWIGKQPMEVSEHPLPADHHLYAQVSAESHLCVGAFGSRLVIKPNEYATAQKRLESKLTSIRAIDAVKVKHSAKLSADVLAAEAQRAALQKADKDVNAMQRRKDSVRARKSGMSAPRLSKFDTNFLEQGDDDDAVAAHARDYADDDDGEQQRKLNRAKALNADDEDEDDDDDDEVDDAPRRAHKSRDGDDEDDEGEEDYDEEEEDGDYAEGDEEEEDVDDDDEDEEDEARDGGGDDDVDDDDDEVDSEATPSESGGDGTDATDADEDEDQGTSKKAKSGKRKSSSSSSKKSDSSKRRKKDKKKERKAKKDKKAKKRARKAHDE